MDFAAYDGHPNIGQSMPSPHLWAPEGFNPH